MALDWSTTASSRYSPPVSLQPSSNTLEKPETIPNSRSTGSRRHTPRARTIPEDLVVQTVAVIATDAAVLVIPYLAKLLISLHAQHLDVARHLEKMVEAHPLYPVLTSLSGMAITNAAIIIA